MWQFRYFWKFFISKVARILGLQIFHGYGYGLFFLHKTWVGLHFGRPFHKLIWSPWRQPTNVQNQVRAQSLIKATLGIIIFPHYDVVAATLSFGRQAGLPDGIFSYQNLKKNHKKILRKRGSFWPYANNAGRPLPISECCDIIGVNLINFCFAHVTSCMEHEHFYET
jgi:hypothetical protein